MKCSVCNDCFHFSPCCAVQQSAYTGMSEEKKTTWKCHRCRERKNSGCFIVVSDTMNQKQKRTEEEDEDETVVDNNKRFKDYMSKSNSKQPSGQQPQNNAIDLGESMKIMMQNMSHITTQLSSISNQLQNQQTTLTQINDKVSHLSTQVIELQKQNQEKDQQINEMQTKINNLEQKAIEKNIEINNINNENLTASEVVEKIATNLCVELRETDIENVYHTKGKNKVVVELSSLRKKKEIMSKLERHRMEATGINKDDSSEKHKYIYINDQLTMQKRRLLWLAKTKAKEASWKFVWVRNGEIYARKMEKTNFININNECDIELIC